MSVVIDEQLKQQLVAILEEASAILAKEQELREPIIDELLGFASILRDKQSLGLPKHG